MSRTVMAWTLGLVGLGVLIYRPWQPIPFDITDFSEILPLLRDTTGFSNRFLALIEYFFGHGRTNILTSALIWSHWELVGLWAVGWRLLRVILLGVLVWTFLRTALRFGLSPLAAGLGASLFVVSRPAAEGWLRLTGEPLAAIFFLLGLGVAIRYHASPKAFRTAVIIGTLSALMVLTKETMISCVPLVWLVAVVWQGERGVRAPKLDRRTLTITAVLGAVTLALGFMMVLVSRQSGPEAYAGAYGTGALDLVRLLYNILATAWPLGEPFQIFSIFGAISCVAVLLGCGLAIRQSSGDSSLAGFLFLLLVCLTGAVIYLPWERYEAFYVIPFLLGPAGLLALAAQALMGQSRTRAALVTGAVAVLLIPPVLDADRERSVRSVTRVVNWELAQALTHYPEADSLFFAVQTPPDQDWQGRGPALARYANVIFGTERISPAIDEPCADVGNRLREPPRQREVIVSYHHWCGPLPGPDVTVARDFRSFRLLPPGVQRSQLSADLLFRIPETPPTEGNPGG